MDNVEVKSQDELPIGRAPAYLEAIEIDCDSLSEKGFNYFLKPAIQALIPVAEKGEVATIFIYETPSFNFGSYSNSMFIGLVGKKNILQDIYEKYLSLNGVRCRQSESIRGQVASRALHVSQGKVWEPYELGSWNVTSITNEVDVVNGDFNNHKSDLLQQNVQSEKIVLNLQSEDTNDDESNGEKLKSKKMWKGKSHFLLKVFRKYGFLPVFDGDTYQDNVQSPVEGETFSAWSQRVLGQSNRDIYVLQLVQPKGNTLVKTLASSSGAEALALVLSARSARVKHRVKQMLSNADVDKRDRTEILLGLRSYLPESLTINEDFGLIEHTALSRYEEDYGQEASAMLVLDEMLQYALHMSETLAQVKHFMRTSDAFDELISVIEKVKGDLGPDAEFDPYEERPKLVSEFLDRFSTSQQSLSVEISDIKNVLESDWLASDKSYSIEVLRVLELCLKRFENLTNRMFNV